MWFQKPSLGTPLDWSNPLNDGCVMHLPMNEGHGDVVRDLSMYGNHGTLNNFAFPPTVASGWNPGQTGVGLNFDGTDDYIDCGNNPSFVHPNITVSCRFKLDSIATDAGIITKDDYGAITNPPYAFFFDSGTTTIKSYITNSGDIPQYCTHSVVTDTWYCAVLTFDGSYVRSYLNTVAATPVAQTDMASGTSKLMIGQQKLGFNRFLNGPIDQPRVMNRAWSAKEAIDYTINPWQVYLDE